MQNIKVKIEYKNVKILVSINPELKVTNLIQKTIGQFNKKGAQIQEEQVSLYYESFELENDDKVQDVIKDGQQLKLGGIQSLHNVSSTQITQQPHPHFSVYPVQQQIDFWKILMIGPKGTAYEGGLYLLYMQFNDNYPYSPPIIRFATPIYHMNINSQGRICHSIIERNYKSDRNVRDIFDAVFGLVLVPEPDDPLDSVIAAEYINNPIKFYENAKKHTKDTAWNNDDKIIKEFLGNIQDNEKQENEIECWVKKVRQSN